MREQIQMRRQRRKLDKVATLARYRARIKLLPDDVFIPLQDTYLSTFDIYSTINMSTDGTLPIGRGMEDCTGFIIAQEAYRRGVHVHGITSARKHRGQYICSVMPSGEPRASVDVVYVGNYLYFTGHTLVSPHWQLNPCDKVYS